MESILIFKNSGPELTTLYQPQVRPEGNRYAAAQPGIYYLRGRRYQADEMLDQTDLNRSTTQFILIRRACMKFNAAAK